MFKFNEFGTFSTSPSQMARFKSGDLWPVWEARYPMLFDSDDIRLARAQAHLGYHFHEWLAAILIYESVGYLSLIEKYEFKNHARKQAILKDLVPRSVLEVVNKRTPERKAQCPDLLCFAPDMSDWFFCEVKGPTDTVKPNPETFFQRLVDCSGKPIFLVKFHTLNSG